MVIATLIASAAAGFGGYGYAAAAARAAIETVRGDDVMSTPINDQLRQGRDCAAPVVQLRRSDMCRKAR
jgi:hypothetical protein